MVILVTGISGSGKSTLCKRLTAKLNLKKLGYKYIDVDQLSHKIYDIPEVLSKVKDLFGNEVFDNSGSFDRKKLGKIFFSEPESEKVIEFKNYSREIIESLLNSELTENCVIDWILLPQLSIWKDITTLKILCESEDNNVRKNKIMSRDNVSLEYIELRDSGAPEYNYKEFDSIYTNKYRDICMLNFIECFIEKYILKQKESKAFYAGSFDPFTNGHLHIVKCASKLFDKVYIGIGTNPKKKRTYSPDCMMTAIEKDLQENKIFNVEVVIFEKLTADIAIELGCDYLIRGIRNGVDYDYEENLAMINHEILGIDTLYLRAGEYGSISSSMVKELLNYDKDVENFVPRNVFELIRRKIC